MHDKDLQKALRRYTNEMRAATDEERRIRNKWRQQIGHQFDSLQATLEASGLDSHRAVLLAMRKPAPTRDAGMFDYLQYRVALAYANAVSALSLLKDNIDPWFTQGIVELIVVLDNDARCHADELAEYCSGWWHS